MTRGVRIFGVLNVTPDSFSDGGRFLAPEDARRHAARLLAEGADYVDVGAESTRPRGPAYGAGYAPLGVADELARLEPVLEAFARDGVPFSIDTTKGEVARRAIEAGAAFVNDTSGGADPGLLAAVAESAARLVLMHNRGRGELEGDAIVYGDVVADVIRELRESTARAVAAGVPAARILWDPGLGFAKTAAQSTDLLRRLPEFVEVGYPVWVGASRKSFLAAHTRRAARRPEAHERLGASVAACLVAARAGAYAVRVHDVWESAQALDVADALDGVAP